VLNLYYLSNSYINLYLPNCYRIPRVSNVTWPRLDPGKKDLDYLHFASPTKIYVDSNDNLGEKKFWSSINFDENVLQQDYSKKDEL